MNNEIEEEKTINRTDEVKKWLDRISEAEKNYNSYYDLIKNTRDYYKNTNSERHNIFWSHIETLKPFLYFKQPRPYVELADKSTNPVSSLAARLLSKALQWDLKRFDFDSVIKYARNDFLISGCGILEEKYEPSFAEVETEDPNLPGIKIKAKIKTDEKVITSYIDPLDFLADSEKVGIWEDASWIARRIYMTKDEAIRSFGEQIKDLIIKPNDLDYRDKTITIYKVWDKKNKVIYWLSKESPNDFLKVIEDPLGIEGFYPIPKPIYATLTNDSLVPVPDFVEIKSILNEFDGITQRMKLVVQALKVSGAYDKAFPELYNILNKDVSLIAVNDFQKLKDSGGIRGILDFAPIEQYLEALKVMSQRKEELKNQLYEITGISDIMRGNSDPNETATAVTKKTNFGSLRNQDRQNDMQRFITDLLRIKAEIICEHFSEQTWKSIAANMDIEQGTFIQAINLLKHDKLRDLTLGIETDTAFNQLAEADRNIETVKLIGEFMDKAVPIIQAQPALLPLYKQMVAAVVSGLPSARQFDGVIDSTFQNLQNQIMAPKPQQPDPNMLKLQQDAQKNAQDFEIKKEQNALKAREINIKEQAEQNKVMLTQEEINAQVALKHEQNLMDDKKADANITTGYVPPFQ